MTTLMRQTLVWLLLLAGSLPAVAQEITFTASVDRNSVATGDPIKLTLQLNNAPPGSGITPPDFGGLVVVQGPFDQNSFSMINGRTSSSVARTYYLQATQPGDYTIGPATARVGGGSIQTQAIRIKVVKGEGTGPSSATLNEAQKRDPNLFCTISLSRNKAYVGEQIIATYTLYSRYNALQPGDYDLPKLDGFWAEEIDLGETSWDKKPTVVNGLAYNTAVLKKQVLFPALRQAAHRPHDAELPREPGLLQRRHAGAHQQQCGGGHRARSAITQAGRLHRGRGRAQDGRSGGQHGGEGQ
ncbi:MAG: BatD family protein [Flavobacteriales bacterium]